MPGTNLKEVGRISPLYFWIHHSTLAMNPLRNRLKARVHHELTPRLSAMCSSTGVAGLWGSITNREIPYI